MHWQDFPEFYNNPTIRRIAQNQKWTVSSTKDKDPKHPKKMPLDMHAFIYNNEIWGCSFTRGYNPLVDLKTLCDTIPNATNNTYYLEAQIDGLVVLDIEPTCDPNVRNELLKLPYLYGETSLSGKGYHLIFDLPSEILNRYPIAQSKPALPNEAHTYEIHLAHMIAFTRKSLPKSADYGTRSIDDFNKLFEYLASIAKPSPKVELNTIDEETIENIPDVDHILDKLYQLQYQKTIDDFPKKDRTGKIYGYDNSAYEFGMSRFYYTNLLTMLGKDRIYNGHEYTDKECALIVYKCLDGNLNYRPKHESTRNGMPWLLFVAYNLVAKFTTQLPYE